MFKMTSLFFLSAIVPSMLVAGEAELILKDDSNDGDLLNQSVSADALVVLRTFNDRLSDASFDTIAQWPNLSGVYLWNSAVTGVGFSELKAHSRLKQVRLSGPNVNDAGIRAASDLSHVTHFAIGNMHGNHRYRSVDPRYREHKPIITDRALAAVATMPKLAFLSIDNANITDEGIQQLAKLTTIKGIDFLHCDNLTLEGIERLKTALPRVRISARRPDLTAE